MNRRRSMTRQPFRSQGANFAALAPVSDLSHSRSLFLRRCRYAMSDQRSAVPLRFVDGAILQYP